MLCSCLTLSSKNCPGLILLNRAPLQACRQGRRIASMVVALATRANGAGPQQPQQSLSVAVIGGGGAGLVAARELMREGHRVRVYEKSAHLGGVWMYSEEVEDDPLGLAPGRKQVHGSMYAQLRTNLPREVMGFSDFPFDAQFPGSQDPRQFCSHQEVLRYLEAFAAAFDLEGVVQTQTEVLRVRPLATHGSTPAARPAAATAAAPEGSASDQGAGSSGQWEVTLRDLGGGGSAAGPATADGSSSNGGTDSRVQYDAVVVCNGHYSQPRVPVLAGQGVFPGQQMHSHNYRTPDAFRGQTVLLLGASSSGVDIAQELAAAGARVYLCARAWENPLTGEVLETSTSTAEAQPGQVVKAANILELQADGSVALESGVTVPHVDTVMYCTGYHYSFPFLDGTGIVGVKDNRVSPLYQHVFPPSHAPGLAFVGLPWKVVPFPQFELQSKWIARVLSGRVQLPNVKEMEAHVSQFYGELEAAGVPVRYTHRQSGDVQWRYNEWLAEACGPDVPRWPEWRVAMYSACGNSRKLHGDAYRDLALPGGEPCEEEARQEAAAVRQRQQRQKEQAVC